MAMFDPVDVEEALAADLSATVPAFPPPVPADMGAELPCALVQRDGGTRAALVIDTHNVTVSVWAADWAAATEAADALAGAVARLPMERGTPVRWLRAEVTALPFPAPDPDRPGLCRVQLAASVSCRCKSE